MSEKKTQVFIERENKEDESGQFVCVNGRTYLVPRGKLVDVPAEVAEVIEHANEMNRKSADFKRGLRM